MIKQLFTAQQPAAQGKNMKSSSPSVGEKNATATSDTTTISQTNDSFAAVLAKQLEEPMSGIIDKTGLVIEPKSVVTKALAAKVKSDTIDAPPPDQPLAALNAMLFGNLVTPAAQAPADSKTTDMLTAGVMRPGNLLKPDYQAGQPAKPLPASGTPATPPVANGIQNAIPLELRAETACQSLIAKQTKIPMEQTLAQVSITASAPPPEAPPATTQTTITAPMGSRAWPEEFTQKINWVSTQQNQVAELHLNPPELGPMTVVLTMADNQASAVFSSAHSAVREAIENAIPKLRESLAENGIMLSNAMVNDQAPRDNGAQQFMQQRANIRTRRQDTVQNTTTAPVVTHHGIVDTFA